MIALLCRNAALRRLAIGFAASQLGMQIGWIALVWFVLNTAHSPQLLAALFVAFQVPTLLQGAVFSMQSSFLYTLAVPLGAMLGGVCTCAHHAEHCHVRIRRRVRACGLRRVPAAAAAKLRAR